jgi:hypothetical protein
MSRKPQARSRFRSLEASRKALERLAPIARFGLMIAGVAIFLDQVRALFSDAQFTWGERRVIALVAAVTLGGFSLAGWAAGQLLRAGADVIEVFIDQAESTAHATFLLETRIVPALFRAVDALECMAEGECSSRGEPAVAVELRAQLDEAIAAEDAERAISCRDALTLHLRGNSLKNLDRRVVSWLSNYIHARIGSGAVTPSVAALTERAADSFGDTPAGAILKATLPDLRRRAGLCPTCARPYRGNGESCRDCRASQAGAGPRRSGEPPDRGRSQS